MCHKLYIVSHTEIRASLLHTCTHLLIKQSTQSIHSWFSDSKIWQAVYCICAHISKHACIFICACVYHTLKHVYVYIHTHMSTHSQKCTHMHVCSIFIEVICSQNFEYNIVAGIILGKMYEKMYEKMQWLCINMQIE